jgi:hypothetical protein
VAAGTAGGVRFQGLRIRYRSANAATPVSKSAAPSNPHGVSVGALAAALAHVPTCPARSHRVSGSVQAVSQQTLSAQKSPVTHCADVAQAPPWGTGVLVGVAVGVLVGVFVGVAVGVFVFVGVLVGVVVGVFTTCPGTFSPATVPKENVAAVTVVSAVMPGTERWKLTAPARNGLWGPLPAMLPLALLYVLLPALGPPIMVCAGNAGAPMTSSVSAGPEVLSAQPVATAELSVNVPLPATVRSVPELEDSVAPLGVVLSVKSKSLRV